MVKYYFIIMVKFNINIILYKVIYMVIRSRILFSCVIIDILVMIFNL